MSNDTARTGQTGGFTRPGPPPEAPAGHHWEAVPEGRGWGIAEPGRKCRFRGSSPHACGEPAAIVVTRGIRRPIPWNYCLPHAYGRWVEDGKVMSWRLREDNAE